MEAMLSSVEVSEIPIRVLVVCVAPCAYNWDSFRPLTDATRHPHRPRDRGNSLSARLFTKQKVYQICIRLTSPLLVSISFQFAILSRRWEFNARLRQPATPGLPWVCLCLSLWPWLFAAMGGAVGASESGLS